MNLVLNHMRNMLTVAVAAVAIGAMANQSQATAIVLTDGNSVAKFHTESSDPGPVGMYEWDVDNVNHVQQQWFWFRAGTAASEVPLSSAAQTAISTADVDSNGQPDLLRTVYTDNSGLRFTITYQLTGGNINTQTSEIAEVIKIENTTNLALSMHFYQYSDFNLNGTPNNDTTVITGGNTATITDGGVTASENVVVPMPAHFEVGLVPSTLTSLNDGGPTTLNDVGTAITGDTSWAFQWDVNLQPQGSFIISKDKKIEALVPEPATMGLLAIGALAGLGRRRRA